MSPEFDPKKNAANFVKHGVSLATGDGVLRDPLAITIVHIAAHRDHGFQRIMNADSSGT